MKKPDNVSDNPGLLPYGSNVGAPAIQVSNIEHWKEPRVSDVNKQFQDRFEGLKNEYQKLIEEYIGFESKTDIFDQKHKLRVKNEEIESYLLKLIDNHQKNLKFI